MQNKIVFRFIIFNIILFFSQLSACATSYDINTFSGNDNALINRTTPFQNSDILNFTNSSTMNATTNIGQIGPSTGFELTINGNGKTISGGNSYSGILGNLAYIPVEYNINSINFNNFKKSGTGGAFYISGKANISGSTFYQNSSAMSGGAIYETSSTKLTINDSTFTENTSTGSTGAGAISVSHSSILNLTNVDFYRNKADSFYYSMGGAAYIAGASTIKDSLFDTNTSGYGGAIHLADANAVNINDSTFISNSAITQGGAINDASSRGTRITGCTFTGNSSAIGGAISNLYNSYELTLNIKDSDFTTNTASNSGGAIYNYSAKLNVNGGTYDLNTAVTSGGAIHNEKAASSWDASAIIKNVTFSNNSVSAGSGGAIANHSDAVLNVADSTFDSNSASDSGGAIYNSSTATMKNSTFTNNSAVSGGAIYNSGTLYLIADDGITSFSGNNSSTDKNAIYNTETLYLNAGNGGYMLFDDKIVSSDVSKNIYINNYVSGYPSNGNIIFNNTISNSSLTLGNGMLTLGQYGNTIGSTNNYFDGSVTLTLNSGILNSVNGQIDNNTLSSFLSSSNAGIYYDANLSSGTSDNFTVSGTSSGSLTIKAINILADGTKNTTLFIGSSYPALNVSDLAAFTDGAKYTFTASNGVLTPTADITKGGLNNAISDTTALYRSFSALSDETVTVNLGTIGKTASILTVFGNQRNIAGASHSGISALTGQILNFYNIGSSTTVGMTGFSGTNGGIINNAGETYLISDTFTNNTATTSGGTVYNSGLLTVNNSYFGLSSSGSGNTAVSGGAIYNSETADIVGSTFTRNTSTGTNSTDGGGAIYNTGTLNIGDSYFGTSTAGTGNSAARGGGIYNSGILNVYESSFTNNKATTNTGGAICNTNIATIKNNDFTSNSSISAGGAIYNSGTIKTLSGNFTSNSTASSGYGGAVYNYGTIYCLGGNFTSNSAYRGGAIHNYGIITNIEVGTTFTSNSATVAGGAVYNEYGTINLGSADFTSNTSSGGQGGAICNLSTISNSSGDYSNNSASWGGAIVNYGSFTIKDGTFTSNSATTSGGAIYNRSGATLTITNEDFKSNSALYGGAIINYGTTSIADSLFIENTATGYYGGAIYNTTDCNITIHGTSFLDNSSTYGGAIENVGTISLTDCSFFNNSAVTSGGAAENYGTLTINSGNYINNSSTSGGAIYNQYGTLTATNSSFGSNTATDSGGAIYNNATATIINSEFNDNSAATAGGAIYNTGTLNLIADGGITNFSGNTVGASPVSNAIYNTGTLNLNAGNGGYILFNDKIASDGILTNIVINGSASSAVDGNIIFNNTITDSTLTLNNGMLTLGQYGNTIATDYFEGTVDLAVNKGILNCANGNIDSNSLNSFIGASPMGSDTAGIFFDAELSSGTSDLFNISGTTSSGVLTIKGINILNDGTSAITLLSGTNIPDISVSDYAAYTNTAKYTFSESGGILTPDFAGVGGLNNAVIDGDKIYRSFSAISNLAVSTELDSIGGTGAELTIFGNQKNITASNVAGISVASGQTLNILNIGTSTTSGINGFSGTNGGFISNAGTTTLIDSTFTQNSSTDTNGGVINNTGTLSSNNSYYGTSTSGSGNTAAIGGAIYNSGTANIVKNYFTFNTATTSGGAIYNDTTGNGVVNDNTFTSNTATSNGGAIYNSGAISSLTNDIFSSNTSSASGGAIYNSGTITSLGGNFVGNTAATSGGAIYNDGIITNVFSDGTLFANNKATTGNGGAIYNETGKTINVGNSYFANNSVSASSMRGGAICNYGTLSGDGGTYSNNSGYYGGAVYTKGASTIDNSTFLNNSGYYGGAVYASSNDITTISNSSFTINSTYYYGGAIDNYGNMTLSNNTFTTNSSSYGGAIINYSTLTINDGTFTGNSAYSGGAIYNLGTLTINDASFDSNYTTVSGDYGGSAICNSGTLSITNSSFKNNSSQGYGGAIYNSSGTATITADGNDIIFSGNTDSTGANDIYMKDGSLVLDAKAITDSITLENGISGSTAYTTITKQGDGELILSGNNSGYSQIFTQTVGITSVSNKFFAGTNNIQGGTLNLNSGSELASTAAINLTNSGTNMIIKDGVNLIAGSSIFVGSSTSLDINTTANNTLDFNSTVTGAGTINKSYGGITNFTANNSGFTGTFNQTSGISNVSNQFFAGKSIIDGGILNFNNGASTPTNSEITFNNGIINVSAEGTGIITFNGAIYSSSTSNIMNINSAGSATGTVDFNNNVSNLTMNIYNGTVDFLESNLTNNIVNIKDATVKFCDCNIDSSSSLSLENATLDIECHEGCTSKICSCIGGSSASTCTVELNKDGNTGKIEIDNNMRNTTVNLYGGTLALANENYMDSTINLGLYGSVLDTQNSSIGTLALGNLHLASGSLHEWLLDADLANNSIDKITAATVTGGGTLTINGINLLSDANVNSLSLNVANSPVKDYITSNINSIDGHIFRYGVSYDSSSGNLNFVKTGYAPGVITSDVAQTQTFLLQTALDRQFFANMDAFMSFPLAARESTICCALSNGNTTGAACPISGNGVFSPIYSCDLNRGIWVKTFTSFENIPLRNGPNVSTIEYGTLIGFDAPLTYLKRGWVGNTSAYVGYLGSNQNYDGVGVSQNGVLVGLAENLVKGNNFLTLMANVGSSMGIANTQYGNDYFSSIFAGAAAKGGHNFELKNGEYIIQPNLMLAYTYTYTPTYNTAAGIEMTSKPLNAIQVAPGIRLIKNLKEEKGQVYLVCNFVYNIMDNTKFSANDVQLPELSIAPYVEYGIGYQRVWKERFVGFFQTLLRGGGRNGVALQLGLRWAI